MKFSIRELLLASTLCAFATAVQAADPDKAPREAAYKETVAHANADYKAAKEACKTRQGNDKDVCMKEAKAAHVKATADAKAKRKSAAAMADARDDKSDANYKVAKEKCDAMSGDAKDACIRDAKMKYHQ
ncbi:MAG TPA: cell envelope biogenesis protein TolA [Casimicrobiaceae bacterium]|nr:cell envelope biogenesis protein TolA [Casimicrobiaceae bacterium]